MRTARLSFVCTLASLALLTGGCSESDSIPATESAQSGASSQRHEYTVRAIVLQVPIEDRPLVEFQAHHERIPEFVRVDGTLGMNEMAMAFPPADGLDLSAISPGDKVEIDFYVDWDAAKKFEMTAIRTLPPKTVLDLSTERNAAPDP